jgi:hypothetical protein
VVVASGVNVIDVPFPTEVPPMQEPEYHCQVDEVPKVPPVNVNIVDIPGQTASGKPSAEMAETDELSTKLIVILIVTQEVVPQTPSALTKYVVATTGITDIIVPLPTDEPPIQEPEYHCQVEEVPNIPPLNVNIDKLPGHTELGKPSAEVAAVETVLTITFEVTQFVVPQVPSPRT